ncbi:hypothetical protein HO133_008479 [Letharia lupina]|uniref:Pantetheine-phosphate adenylyltransferase n=1 Tax=Letharia lupina TaxID=560253 RepID=A0A8H6CP43_9LECA|nr:uncharacterized protein HO133_008479 [Letharia lupina]KAF6227038.1 hypothetical protein HO133_008479 [Letharia lupina]
MADGPESSPLWLLLLPRPPSEISLNALRVAYGQGLTQVLQMASNASAGSFDVVLDVAIAYEDEQIFRYPKIQRLLGLMYRLICVICTENSIDLQYDNDVDVRLIIFHRGLTNQHQPAHPRASQRLQPFGDLQTLAGNDRAWQRLCSLESEPAESLLQDFLRIRGGSSDETMSSNQIEIERLPGGLSIHQSSPQNAFQEISSGCHCSIAVGGTFDHLHVGHKLLLTMTALVLDPRSIRGACLTIGITGDELLKNKNFREELEDFPERQLAVQEFLLGILGLFSLSHVLDNLRHVESNSPHGREVHNTLKSGLIIKYVEIFDPCGPTITDETITALVLSAETKGGGQVVNDKRGEKGWSALEVFEVDVLEAGEADGDSRDRADDKFQGKISSTDIRRRIHEKSATKFDRSSGDSKQVRSN